jgi:hypothetical protein
MALEKCWKKVPMYVYGSKDNRKNAYKRVQNGVNTKKYKKIVTMKWQQKDVIIEYLRS